MLVNPIYRVHWGLPTLNYQEKRNMRSSQCETTRCKHMSGQNYLPTMDMTKVGGTLSLVKVRTSLCVKIGYR